MDFQKEVTDQLTAMGFDAGVITRAYQASDIKTVEGVINYIDAHPEIQVPQENTGAMQEETAPKQANDGAMEEEKPQAQPQGEPISAHVNSQLRDNLIAMGYKKNPAEKALLLTGNKTIQAAIDWMDQNKDLPDFNEPMFLVAPDPNAEQAQGVPKKSNLTPEEARAQAKALQKKLRENRIKKEKELEEQREADRLRSGKDMSIALRKMKEQQAKQDIDYLKRQKKEKEDAMAKVLEQIERDREERTGKKRPKKLKPPKEIISNIYKKMRTVYPKGSASGSLVNVCFKTCGIYISKFLLIKYFNKNQQII